MKLSLTSTLHYILFALVLLLLPVQVLTVCKIAAEVKTGRDKAVATTKENTAEILHSEILFRY